MYDIIIIGAGITGSFIAHNLSKRQCKVLVIDKEADVANATSMANSAIIHAGYDPKPGTLKAKLNVLGNRMYPDICKELGVTYRKCSAFVVAVDSDESKILDTLKSQAEDRDVTCIDRSGEDARKLEPNLSPSVIRALEFPDTGIIYPWNVAIALMEEAVLNGTELKLCEKVVDITKTSSGYTVTTDKSVYESEYVINAAGLYADRIYEMALKSKPDYSIIPKRGEYYVLDEMAQTVVNRIIYPVPGPAGKGVLVIPTIHNNILLGPNSDITDSPDNNNNTASALNYVKQNVGKTVINIPYDKVIRTFAGLRPSGNDGDFYIKESESLSGFVNVACIDSPGLASAPAIAEYVINEVMQGRFNYELKSDYIHRTPIKYMNELDDEAKNEMIARDPSYGEIVCRCCLVSKGEILDAIRRPVGATTVKGVKKRVGPGLGRCQGGFCEPLVVDILAEELGIDKTQVRYDSPDSVMLVDKM